MNTREQEIHRLLTEAEALREALTRMQKDIDTLRSSPQEPAVPTLEELISKKWCNNNSYWLGNIFLSSESQKKQLLAISHMMLVAEYVNEGWKPDWGDQHERKHFLFRNEDRDDVVISITYSEVRRLAMEYFKSVEAAELAAKIMGPERMNHYFGIFND